MLDMADVSFMAASNFLLAIFLNFECFPRMWFPYFQCRTNKNNIYIKYIIYCVLISKPYYGIESMKNVNRWILYSEIFII